jgi:hypothetical protein
MIILGVPGFSGILRLEPSVGKNFSRIFPCRDYIDLS